MRLLARLTDRQRPCRQAVTELCRVNEQLLNRLRDAEAVPAPRMNPHGEVSDV